MKKMMAMLLALLLLAGTCLAETDQAAYTLDKVVVLSRHNIRSPLSGSGSLLGTLRPTSGLTGPAIPASCPCAAPCWKP